MFAYQVLVGFGALLGLDDFRKDAFATGYHAYLLQRFSGTEPLIRIFCEMPTKEQAIEVCEIYEKFLGLK